VTTQSTEVSSLLPKLPPRLSTLKSIPWLSLSEIDEYLVPLRANIPWTFTTSNSLYGQEKIPKPSHGPGWSYHGKYKFDTREAGLQFTGQTRQLLSDEGIHHVSAPLFNSSNFYFVLSSTPSCVDQETMLFFRLKTANAYLPKEISDLRPQVPAREDTPFPESIVVPGLTIRDIRIAMLIDQMYTAEYGASLSSPPTLDEYPSAQHMVSNIFRHGFCPCCALPHPLHQCEKRSAYPPQKHCDVCGRHHWIVDCAAIRLGKAKTEKKMEKESAERRERRNQKKREWHLVNKEKRRTQGVDEAETS